MPDSYSADSANAADASARRNSNEVAPPSSDISAITVSYCDGSLNTVTEAQFLAATPPDDQVGKQMHFQGPS